MTWITDLWQRGASRRIAKAHIEQLRTRTDERFRRFAQPQQKDLMALANDEMTLAPGLWPVRDGASSAESSLVGGGETYGDLGRLEGGDVPSLVRRYTTGLASNGLQSRQARLDPAAGPHLTDQTNLG